jgi:DNA-binding PadR family transcriptional regulator
MKRKPGALFPLELSILRAGVALASGREQEFHGYAIATRIHEEDGRRLTAQGTLYRALSRLEEQGLLESWWEDHTIAEAEQRPRRRLYRVTALGEAAVEAVAQGETRPLANLRTGREPV